MALVKRTFCLDNILQGGEICSNPTITWEAPSCIAVECITNNNKCIEVEILEDCPDSCITVTIDCDDCAECPPVTQQICFCLDSDDCTGPCEFCDNGVCKSFCPDGKVCDNETCVDCVLDSECECDQVCIQGTCQCPAGLIERVDGCCVECIDNTNCGPCEVCVNGECVPKDCPDGFCHPVTGICQECVDNEDCTDPNTCCVGGQCVCCPGYFQDPLTGLCIPIPNCFESSDCPVCFDCENGICVPKSCPDGQVCDPNTGNCVPECENGDCPDGSGCINGICIPCDELSCTPAGLQCEFALGCECVDGDCVPIDCDLTDVSLEWVVTPGLPGTVTNPGQPPLQGTWGITPGSVTTSPPIYINHNFTFTIPNGGSGTWRVYTSTTNFITQGSTSNSVSFSLSSINPLPLWIFEVEFTEAGTGRVATFTVWASTNLSLTDPNRFNNSNVEFNSNGIPPSTTGGSPGTLKLCPNNGNFSLVSATGSALSGDIIISFFSDGQGCLTAIVTGCGLWDGTAIAECGGVQVEIPIPEFYRDPANCCDPTDPNCDGVTFGDPCTTPTIVTIPLTAWPSYGIVSGGPNNNDGEFSIIANWEGVLSPTEAFSLSVAPGCWSTGPNAMIVGNPEDISISTNSPGLLGIAPNTISTNVTMGEGGCVFLGQSCDIRISGCRQLEGEVCLDKCSAFEVKIVAQTQIGPNTYEAFPSLMGATITYRWTYPGPTVLLGVTKQVTIVPVANNSTLTVTSTFGSPACSDDDSLLFNTQISGCPDPLACNFDGATQDDGSCVFITLNPYICSGGFQGATITGPTFGPAPVVTYSRAGVPLVVGTGMTVGTHLIEINFDGVLTCTKSLSVGQCYSCNVAEDCVFSPNNLGGFPSEAECLASCGCDLFITYTLTNCNNGQSAFEITVFGSTGPFIIGIEDDNNNLIWSTVGVPSGVEVTSPLVCSGNYQIIASTGLVLDEDCVSVSRFVTCNCDGSTVNITSIAPTTPGSTFCDNGCLRVDFTTGICGDHRLSIFSTGCDAPLNTALATVTFPHSVTTFANLCFAVPPDGVYYAQLLETTSGCVDCVPFTINCGGTLTCDISNLTVNVQTNDGANVTMGGTVTLGTSGTNNYRAELYQINGSCTTPIVGVQLLPSVLLSGTGGSVPYSITRPHNGTTNCFGVRIVKVNNPSCILETVRTIVPAPIFPCSPGTFNTPVYTEGNQTLVVTLATTFQNTTGGVNVYVQVAESPLCSAAGDDFLQAGVLYPTSRPFQVGWGQVGSIGIPIDQINVGNCITITMVNAGEDPGQNFNTAVPTGCYVQTTFVIPACTCDIGIAVQDVSVDPVAEELFIEFFTTECTSGNIDFEVTGDADSGGVVVFNSASTDGNALNHNYTIPLTTYLAAGGTVDLTWVDSADPTCNGSILGIPLPSQCDATVNITETPVNCTYEIQYFHPVSGVSNQARALPLIDGVVTIDAETDLISLCSGNVITNSTVSEPEMVIDLYQTFGSLQDGLGNLQIVRVYDAAAPGVPIDVPLAPSGANIANFGPEAAIGNLVAVTPADLTFDAANPAIFEQAITDVIENHLFNLAGAYVPDVDYVLSVEVTESAGLGSARIAFEVRHAPTGSWIGIDKTDGLLSGQVDGAISSSTNVVSFDIGGGGTLTKVLATPCGSNATRIMSFNHAVGIDIAGTNYNVVVVNSTPVTLSNVVNTTQTCSTAQLTATITGTCGTPTYLWAPTGETTSTIYVPLGSGNHQVTLSCDGCPDVFDTEAV